MAYTDLDVAAVNKSDEINTVVGGAAKDIRNILGGTTSQFSSYLSSGDFVGIDEKGLESLQKSIDNFCRNIESVVAGFNEDASISEAFKGEVGTAVQEFVKETKKLLNAFVGNLRRDSVEAGEIFLKYQEEATKGKQDVNSGVEGIRSNAEKIKFDDVSFGGGNGGHYTP